jgi:hypothetical protein
MIFKRKPHLAYTNHALSSVISVSPDVYQTSSNKLPPLHIPASKLLRSTSLAKLPIKSHATDLRRMKTHRTALPSFKMRLDDLIGICDENRRSNRAKAQLTKTEFGLLKAEQLVSRQQLNERLKRRCLRVMEHLNL